MGLSALRIWSRGGHGDALGGVCHFDQSQQENVGLAEQGDGAGISGRGDRIEPFLGGVLAKRTSCTTGSRRISIARTHCLKSLAFLKMDLLRVAIQWFRGCLGGRAPDRSKGCQWRSKSCPLRRLRWISSHIHRNGCVPGRHS